MPAPSFLVYYRLRLTSKPQPPLSSGVCTLHKDVSPAAAEAEALPLNPDTTTTTGQQQEQQQQQQQQRQQQQQQPEEEKFLALVRFAVIASKGHQEWIAAGESRHTA